MAPTSRQKKFAATFDGNATESARRAGYAGDDPTLATQGYRLLRNAEVAKLIAAREEGALEKLTLSLVERQQLWSEIAVDRKQSMRDRLKASELLGRSQGDFTDRLEVKGELTLLELVRESMGSKK